MQHNHSRHQNKQSKQTTIKTTNQNKQQSKQPIKTNNNQNKQQSKQPIKQTTIETNNKQTTTT